MDEFIISYYRSKYRNYSSYRTVFVVASLLLMYFWLRPVAFVTSWILYCTRTVAIIKRANVV